jgi:outer membrane receptor protein involved in Fe transport
MFPSVSYYNATSATVKGLEIELRKSLDFIPAALFRSLSLTANASIIKSIAKLDKEAQTSKSDIIAERPLQGQAPYLLNAGLYYDNAGWGTKIAFIYNYVGENIYAAGMDKTSSSFINGPVYRGSLIELPRQLLDFSFTQRIGKGIQVKFTVQNLLDAKKEMIEDYNFTNKYERLIEIPATNTGELPTYEGDNIASSYRPERYFSLSISYSF